MVDKILEIKNLVKGFPITGGFLGREVARVHAVRGVTFSIDKGETLGLVGESGSGKSTLGLLTLKLIDADSGKIIFDGHDITDMPHGRLRKLRREMQIVFQDPYASLNPRMTIGEIIAEPLLVHKVGKARERRDAVYDLLKIVGLSDEAYGKYPHEFSGGQRQRIGIARAIALNPKYIVADEPVSALDVSIRGEILNLLADLRRRFNLSYLFITHDLMVVQHISQVVAVMYLGKLMEKFPADGLSHARHPYTKALLSAIPLPDPREKKTRIVLKGDVPSPITPPSGCPFHPRCQYAQDICANVEPEFKEYVPGRAAACHFIDQMKEGI